ncbi:amidohydrolase [Microbacterium resistens]|uniref:amidohydrolase n=1 Tax=Microbacterium resistens TaxID=156977 RepID=UPI0008362F48|nr:amidohydrolase [Microbacterium resistens]
MANELCIVGGRVLTMDAEDRVAQALRSVDGEIVAVGTDEEILAAATADAEIVDVKGATVLPGLIDAHSHIEMLAYAWELAEDVRAARVSSIEELVLALRARAGRTPEGEWVIGHGQHFQDSLFEEQRFPDRHDLDRVSTSHPVMYRSSFHTNIFNSAALARMGVTAATPDAPGGRIERDEDGEPTGRTFDMFAAIGGPQAPVPVLADAIERVQEMYLRVGVTGLGEISLLSHGLDAMLDLARRGELKLRTTSYATYPNVVDEETVTGGALAQRFEGIDEDRLKLGGVKLFLDGGLTSLAAALTEDYPDKPGYRGELAYEQEELRAWVSRVSGLGLQIAIHAIGDRALDEALDAIEAAGDGARRLRHRIEHAGNLWMTPERIARLVELGAVPVPQPAFILTTALGYRRHLGDRIGDLMPFRSLIDAGLALVGNSDAIGITADQHDPFPAIQAVITRHTHDGQPVDPHQALTLMESLGMYTRDAAYAVQREDEIGSLEPGKRADFVILDEDLLTLDAEDIGAIRPRETWIDGERVYARDVLPEG